MQKEQLREKKVWYLPIPPLWAGSLFQARPNKNGARPELKLGPGRAWGPKIAGFLFGLAWNRSQPIFPKMFRGRFPQHNPPNKNIKSNFCGIFRPESNGIGPGTPIIKSQNPKLLMNFPLFPLVDMVYRLLRKQADEGHWMARKLIKY